MSEAKSNLKAYSVQACEAGCVVFAEKSVVARRVGANLLDTTFEDIESCRRFPEVDHFNEIGRVPFKTLVEDHKWYASCGNCGSYVYATDVGRKWLDEERVLCPRCSKCDGIKPQELYV